MRLVTSTGDFAYYVNTVAEEVRSFKNSNFKYINLEQLESAVELFSENDDDWKRFADELGEAAIYAGVKYVVSHAPCINAFSDLTEDTYNYSLRAIRNSIKVCNVLGIERIVVHSCPHQSFTAQEFYKRNKAFYGDLFDLMEKYQITVMTENWDTYRYPVATGKELREFTDYVNHPLLGVCWDTAHGNICETAREIGQYKNIIDIGDKLKGTHISDNFGDCHQHTWPFAGIINFDSIMQGLIDVNYDGYFTFEASYSLLHQNNWPYKRQPWEYNGEKVTKLLSPSIELKQQAVDLLYETGKYILETYNCFEE